MAALAATEDVTALLTRCRMDPKQIKQTAKNAKGIADRFARVARAGGVFGAYVFWCLFWCFGVSWFSVFLVDVCRCLSAPPWHPPAAAAAAAAAALSRETSLAYLSPRSTLSNPPPEHPF